MSRQIHGVSLIISWIYFTWSGVCGLKHSNSTLFPRPLVTRWSSQSITTGVQSPGWSIRWLRRSFLLQTASKALIFGILQGKFLSMGESLTQLWTSSSVDGTQIVYMYFQKISISPPQRGFFPLWDHPSLWKFQLSFLHPFKLLSHRNLPLPHPQEIPVPSVGEIWNWCILQEHILTKIPPNNMSSHEQK